MSRINEALRRAAGDASLNRETAGPVEGTRGESLLERYPREGRASNQVVTRPEPPVARADLHVAPLRQAPTVATAPGHRANRADGVVRPVNNKLLAIADKTSLPAEQYRRLAASVHELQAERGVKTLMITSAVPQEGKTLTATNLAFTLSESYERRVLLIDADLRRPGVHQLLGIRSEIGVSEVLQDERRDLPVVEISSRLHVLPAGRPQANPLAGLVSDRMRTLVEDAESKYDWVLIDTPPVGVMAEAQLLARVTHGVIFVIRAGSTSFPAIERAIEELGREAIVGTVLNGTAEDAIPTVGYYREYAEAAE
jgi:protein-tyrosine kinase